MANVKVRIVGSNLDRKKKPDIWEAYSNNIPERKNCSIKGCTRSAKVGGHVWVELEDHKDYCHIVPICETHATNSKLHFPNPLTLNAHVHLHEGNLKTRCKCSDELIPGEVYRGQYKVLNVGSSLDRRKKKDIWEEYQSQIAKNQNCTIRGCGEDATEGGHVWVKERNDFCFILPLCEECAEPQKLKPNYPNDMYKLTNKNVDIVVGSKKEKCKCSDRLLLHEVYCGQFSVTNVQGSCIDPGGKLSDWKKWTGLEEVPNGKCQLSYCRGDGVDGAHVWLERRRDFCFILPLCIDHNRPNGSKYFCHPVYKTTLTTAHLVVRKPAKKCGIHSLDGTHVGGAMGGSPSGFDEECETCQKL